MGITTTTVQVTQAEGWKQALVGEGIWVDSSGTKRWNLIPLK